MVGIPGRGGMMPGVGMGGPGAAPMGMAGGPGAGGPMGGDPGSDGEQPNVTPEEQAEYDAVVGQALNLLYDERVLPGIVKRLRSSDPVDALANTTVMAVRRVEDSARKAGREISGDVLLHGATEVMQDIAEIAEAARVHEYTPEEIEAAFYRALDTYRQIKQQAGELHTEALQEDLSMLMEADRRGELGRAFPELEQRFGNLDISGIFPEADAGRQPGNPARDMRRGLMSSTALSGPRG